MLLAFELAGQNAAIVLSVALTLRVSTFVLLSPLAGAIADRQHRTVWQEHTHLHDEYHQHEHQPKSLVTESHVHIHCHAALYHHHLHEHDIHHDHHPL